MLDFSTPWNIREGEARAFLSHVKAQMSGDQVPEHPKELESIAGPDGLRVIRVQGVLFQRENFWTYFGYGTSYDSIFEQLVSAKRDPTVKEILLYVDSPGGAAMGNAELSDYIRECTKEKPVYAYVSGLGASAAYWLASATNKVYATRASYVGCIGCIATMFDFSEAMKNRGVKELVFVSSGAPDKHADITTDHGRELIQKQVDQMGALFVDAVAANRGTTNEIVLEKFGRGDCLIATEAAEVGMIDAVSNLSEAIQEIRGSREENRSTVMKKGDTLLGLEADEGIDEVDEDEATEGDEQPEAAGEEQEEPQAEEEDEDEVAAQAFIHSNPKAAMRLMKMGAADERKRIKSIDEVAAEYPHNKELVQEAKYGSSMSAGDFALAAIKQSKANRAAAVKNLNDDAEEIPEIDSSSPSGDAQSRLERHGLEHAKGLKGTKR